MTCIKIEASIGLPSLHRVTTNAVAIEDSDAEVVAFLCKLALSLALSGRMASRN